MRTCPKCRELNGEGRSTCWKCSTSLGAVDTYKKMCPQCETVYPAKTERCSVCGVRLATYTGNHISAEPSGKSESVGCGLRLAAFLIPVLGIILGCIYIGRREDEAGKSLIWTGILSMILYTLLSLILR